VNVARPVRPVCLHAPYRMLSGDNIPHLSGFSGPSRGSPPSAHAWRNSPSIAYVGRRGEPRVKAGGKT